MNDKNIRTCKSKIKVVSVDNCNPIKAIVGFRMLITCLYNGYTCSVSLRLTPELMLRNGYEYLYPDINEASNLKCTD